MADNLAGKKDFGFCLEVEALPHRRTLKHEERRHDGKLAFRMIFTYYSYDSWKDLGEEHHETYALSIFIPRSVFLIVISSPGTSARQRLI